METKFTQKHIDGLKVWLELKLDRQKKAFCPFSHTDYPPRFDCKICFEYFPKAITRLSCPCRCEYYPMSEIISKVEEVIKEYEIRKTKS